MEQEWTTEVKCSNCNELLDPYSSVDEMQSQMEIHCHCDCGVTSIVASRGIFTFKVIQRREYK